MRGLKSNIFFSVYGFIKGNYLEKDIGFAIYFTSFLY